MAENLLLNSPHLLQKISLSPVMLRLMQEAVKPEPDFGVMAETIRLDPALATTTLNLVNSAFYGLPQKVTDLNRAVSVLGSREMLKVAVVMSLQKDLEHGFPDCEYDFFPDWRLIVWSAIAAELLAARLCPRESDQAYLSALLKDVSLLFLRCAAKELLPSPDLRDHITVLGKGQLEYEEERWGMHHGALSQMLLTRWGIPAAMCESIRVHHAVDSLAEQTPLAQAVILATQWSEMELGHSSGPFSVVQFEVLLRGVLGMNEREVDALRSECLEKFRSMLESLGIGEGDQNRAYYRHSVKVMQGYCFLSMDLLTAEGGLESVARTVGKHIKLNWDVKSWDLALRAPHGKTYSLFHLTPEGRLEQSEGRFPEGRVPWRVKHSGLQLTFSGQRLGELRLGEANLPQDEMDNLALYLRFLSQGYEYYCARQAVLEEKARVFDKIPIGVARLDGAGIVVEANGRIGEYLGLDAPARGRPLAWMLSRRLTVETVAEVDAFLADAARASYGRIVYFLEQKQDDRPADGCLYLSAHRVKDAQGEGVLVLLEDLRGLSELEVQTLRRKNFLERLIGSMQEVVLTVTAKGLVDFCSRQDLGLSGRDFFAVFVPQQPFEGPWGTEIFAAPTQTPVGTVLTTQGGSQLPFELSIAPLTGRAGTAREYLVVGRDMTQIRRLEAKLKVRALFDGLTGLFNHYQFHTTLEREVTRCRRTGRGLGMVFFDLDKFKAVNDTQGHLAGDAVLKGVGAMLMRQVRQGMDYPCRYGGDEFVVIVTEVDEERLRGIGERILLDVRELFKGLVTVSVGLSMLQGDDTPESLLRRVDNLAYASKSAGGDSLSEG
ncbi:MAG: HDOD domain-containing protein [Proteobacteria bacterium]|nr:HDOD domain-containing protein [Pseudomonadota bacterium]MBU1595377.1 HDOD domain-containing protein [Pseudomonadota bacterium]